MLFQINFQEYSFRVKQADGKQMIFDIVRKKFIVITPEEWVRQNLLHYLIFEKKYPQHLFAIEHGINLNGLQKRCDMVVFNKDYQPAMIIECKKPEIELSNTIFEQAARYNLTLQVPYLAISNGVENMVAEIDLLNAESKFLNDYPLATII